MELILPPWEDLPERYRNKMFAKLGSDMKKLAAITEIRKDEFKEKI